MNILCSFCLCLAVAMQNGGNCHKCIEGALQSDALNAVSRLQDPGEYMAVTCYPKGTKPEIDFGVKQGAIVSKKK